jgi:hypothetical protein
MRKKIRRPVPRRTYSMVDELMASATSPMPDEKRRFQLTRMWQGLRAMEADASPTREDWAVVSDAVNLLETLVDMGEVADAAGLLPEAVAALAQAGQRHLAGQRLGLTGAGIQTVRAVLEDYASALEQLPARTIVRCHRLTEARLQDILSGRRRLPHDVQVMAS